MPIQTKKAYEHYAAEMKRVSAEREKETRNLLASRKTYRGKLENKLAKMKEVLLDEKDEQIRDSYRRDVKKAENDIEAANQEIADLEKKAQATQSAILTYEQFIELMEKVPKILAQIKEMKELDYIYRQKILLELFYTGQKGNKINAFCAV